MRILLVEDDEPLGNALRAGLGQAGYTVDWLQDGHAADDALRTETFDAIILDLTLPGLDGLEVLSAYRRRDGDAPVLILTARDAVPQRVRGLDAGADDYLIKPCDLDELSARLRASIRRRAGHAHSVLSAGDIRLDPAAREVSRNGCKITLTRREYALLELFVSHPKRVFARGHLEDTLYGWDEHGAESNTLEVHIHNLRRKIGRDRIETMRGVGYRLVTE